jgi:hypothetical protein
LLLEDAGIVNQSVQASKFVVDSPVHGVDLGLDSNVSLVRDGVMPIPAQRVKKPAGGLFAVQVVNPDSPR